MYFIVGEETVFLDFLRLPDWICKLNWKRQINRIKAYRFYYTLTFTWDTSHENEYPKKWPEHKAFIPFTQISICEELIKQGFRLGVVNTEAVTRKIKSGLTTVCLYRFSAPNDPSVVIRMSSSSLYVEVAFCIGVLWPVSGKKGEDVNDRVISLLLLCSQIPLA